MDNKGDAFVIGVYDVTLRGRYLLSCGMVLLFALMEV